MNVPLFCLGKAKGHEAHLHAIYLAPMLTLKFQAGNDGILNSTPLSSTRRATSREPRSL